MKIDDSQRQEFFTKLIALIIKVKARTDDIRSSWAEASDIEEEARRLKKMYPRQKVEPEPYEIRGSLIRITIDGLEEYANPEQIEHFHRSLSRLVMVLLFGRNMDVPRAATLAVLAASETLNIDRIQPSEMASCAEAAGLAARRPQKRRTPEDAIGSRTERGKLHQRWKRQMEDVEADLAFITRPEVPSPLSLEGQVHAEFDVLKKLVEEEIERSTSADCSDIKKRAFQRFIGRDLPVLSTGPHPFPPRPPADRDS